MRENKAVNVKTSLEYPLVINGLGVPGARGELGLTFCPGKKAKSYIDGSYWSRQLDLDVDRIAQWGASAVVSLVEFGEMVDLEVLDLPNQLARAGMEWLHLPIVDAGVPDKGFEWQWVYAGERIRQLLAQGSNVVLHCRGGLGRTGLVAALVLIQQGIPAEEAMRRVRVARPNAIENQKQETYLKNFCNEYSARAV